MKTGTAAKAFSPLLTPDGQPDLHGVWSFAVGIPLERPGKFGEKLVIDEEAGEVAELQKPAVERNVGKDSREGAGTDADVGHAYNALRFTRVGAETLFYSYTIDDPTTWTKAWTVELPMSKTQGSMYEYRATRAISACLES